MPVGAALAGDGPRSGPNIQMLATYDYIRRIRPIDELLHAVSIYLVAIAAFGSFDLVMSGHVRTEFDVPLKLA